MVKIATGEGTPCCNFFVVMRSRFARNFHYQCVKPEIATDSELSYRLTDETIVCSEDDVMILLRVGDGPDEAAQKHKSDPRFPCTKYMRS
jgi:hypothetical protein